MDEDNIPGDGFEPAICISPNGDGTWGELPHVATKAEVYDELLPVMAKIGRELYGEKATYFLRDMLEDALVIIQNRRRPCDR